MNIHQDISLKLKNGVNILWEPRMLILNVVEIRQEDVDVFHRLGSNFDTLVMLEERIRSLKSEGFILWAPCISYISW